MNATVISVVWSSNRTKDAVEIADAGQSAKRFDGLLVRLQNIAEADAIVPPTDLPAA